MPTTSYLIRWTGPSQRQSEAEFHDVDGLFIALDRITCDSIEAQTSLEADLYTSPTVIDPLLIQFTIGHPYLATLLWHLDGETLIADDPHPSHSEALALPDPDHVEGTLRLATRGLLHPSVVRDALVIYVLTGERAHTLCWSELCQD